MAHIIPKLAALGLIAWVSLPLTNCDSALQPVQAQGRPEPAQEASSTVLVELFTSEGCSSCPPADALLRQMSGTRTSLGQLIVGISEHVTYWNGLGWSDPFSAKAYTDRQNAYSTRFNLDSVYTPQMVINGTEQIVGSDRGSLEQAFRQENGRPQMTLHLLASAIDQSVPGSVNLMISFFHGEAPGPDHVDVFAVLADDLDHSTVSRGENSGRTLTHVSVARSLMHLATVQAAGQTSLRIPMPTGFLLRNGGHHIVLFAQSAHYGPVLATVTHPL